MRPMALTILFFTAVSSCQSGFFAYDLDAPKNSVKSDKSKVSPLAVAMSEMPEDISHQVLVVKEAGFEQIASTARTMLAGIENLSRTSLPSYLLEYLKNQALFLAHVESFLVDFAVLKSETISTIEQLARVAPRLDEIVNPPNEKQDLDKNLIRAQIKKLQASEINLFQEENSKKRVDALPVHILLNQLKDEKKLLALKINNPKDLMIYADYLKIKNYGVFIVDVAAILAEASRINLSEEQAHEWLLGIINREALKQEGISVAILPNSAQLKVEGLEKVKTHVIFVSNQKMALTLPLSLLTAEDIIDKAFLAAKDLAIVKDMIKVAKALDGEAFSIGLVDELSQKFLAESSKLNPEQKKRLSKLLIKQTFNSSDELIDFIDSFSIPLVQQKLLQDRLWFHKNFKKDSLSFEQLLTRIAESRAKLAMFDSQDSKDLANRAKIETDIVSALAASAISDASLAQNAKQQQLASIDVDTKEMQQFTADKQKKINTLLSQFEEQFEKLILDVFSDVDLSMVNNANDLKSILEIKIKQIKNLPQINALKELLDKKISKLDSRISTSGTIHSVMTNRATKAIGNILFKTAAGYFSSGPAGALAAAATATTKAFTDVIFDFLKD